MDPKPAPRARASSDLVKSPRHGLISINVSSWPKNIDPRQATASGAVIPSNEFNLSFYKTYMKSKIPDTAVIKVAIIFKHAGIIPI